MKNTSGIKPVEFNVLVLQDEVDEQTKGGLYLPSEAQERDVHAQTRGVIVALSALSFNADIWPEYETRPKPGARIVFAKHSGRFIEGNDGVRYRLIKDKDVAAIVEDDDCAHPYDYEMTGV